jgi:hypothetical protein
MTWWDASHKGWSVVLEEEGQPPKPITGGYHAAVLFVSLFATDPLLLFQLHCTGFIAFFASLCYPLSVGYDVGQVSALTSFSISFGVL